MTVGGAGKERPILQAEGAKRTRFSVAQYNVWERGRAAAAAGHVGARAAAMPRTQPGAPALNAKGRSALERAGIDLRGKVECWFKPSDYSATPEGGAWEHGVITRATLVGGKDAVCVSFPTPSGEWSEWPAPMVLTETKWRAGWRREPVFATKQPAAAARGAGASAKKQKKKKKKKKKRPREAAAPAQVGGGGKRARRQGDGASARPRQPATEAEAAAAPSAAKRPLDGGTETPREFVPRIERQRRPWLTGGGATLRERLLNLRVPATGRLAGAGTKLVGDMLPARCWECTPPDWVYLPVALDDDAAGTFRVLRERKALEVNRTSKPVVITSPAIAQRYARAMRDIEEPGVCPSEFLGKGAKIVILFDWIDREKMVDHFNADGLPIYINPLAPPSDPDHSCWGATCYLIELRADQADTLVIPAGMMHFVLTVEASTLVCIELSSPLASVSESALPSIYAPPLHTLGHVYQGLTAGRVWTPGAVSIAACRTGRPQVERAQCVQAGNV